MMQSFTTLLDKFRNDGIGCGGFQQLDARFADGQHRSMNFFDLDGLPQRHRQPELVAIKFERPIDGSNGNPQMVNS